MPIVVCALALLLGLVSAPALPAGASSTPTVRVDQTAPCGSPHVFEAAVPQGDATGFDELMMSSEEEEEEEDGDDLALLSSASAVSGLATCRRCDLADCNLAFRPGSDPRPARSPPRS